jgi:Tol biopolymer transport system component
MRGFTLVPRIAPISAVVGAIVCGSCVGSTTPRGAPTALVFAAYPGVARVDLSGTRYRVLASDTSRVYIVPEVSPDGMKVLTASFTRDHSAGWVTIMNTDGSAHFDVAPLTIIIDDFLAPPDRPLWSPDGVWIAYELDTLLRAVHPDGTGDHRVAGGAPFSWSWSPDSKSIAYAGGTAPGIFVTSVDGATTTLIPGSSAAVTVGWSPRNAELWYLEPFGLHVISLDGSSDRIVVPGNTNVAGIGRATWSPDGSQLAVQQGTGLVVVDRNGSNFHTAATVSGGADIAPAWSPDARFIAFTDVVIGPNGPEQLMDIDFVTPDGRTRSRAYQANAFFTTLTWIPADVAP